MTTITDDIAFPIFAISNTRLHIWSKDKISYVETVSGVFILDNKNLVGDTLGLRRLRINSSKIYRLGIVLHNIEQLIKSKYKTFIDNNGYVFTYKKTTRTKLKYYEVKGISRTADGCIISFKSIDNSILVSCKEAYDIKYVGFLISHIGYIPYEYATKRKNDTWRKI